MVVAIIKALFHVRRFTSLKDKRSMVNSLKAQAAHNFGASVAETGLQDDRNDIELGLAIVSSDRPSLEGKVGHIRDFFWENSEQNLSDFSVEYEDW